MRYYLISSSIATLKKDVKKQKITSVGKNVENYHIDLANSTSGYILKRIERV